MSDDRPERPDALEVQPENIADDLAARDQWLVWEYEWKVDREEWSKVPKDGAGGGYNINATDPENGVAFDVAVETYESGDYDGLGYITDPDSLVVGFDWDDCRDPERPKGSVPDVVGETVTDLETYTEVSPSGTGYRQFAFGTRPGGDTRADLPCDPVLEDTPHLEMYDGTGGRYLTVTGHHVGGTPETVETRPQETKAIHEELIADDQSSELGAFGNDDTPSEPVDLDDRELVEKAKNAENGDEFRRLWNGDTSMHSGDHSRADLALCGHLAFWTGGDRVRIDSLFRGSGLMRAKWDEDRGAQTYGERTIDKALEGRTEFYDPEHSGAQKAASDGGVAAATPADSSPDVSIEMLTQAMVRSYAGLGDDDEIGDLNDRQKAAYVWMLAKESDKVHVRESRDNGELWAFDPETGTWGPEGERALQHAAREALGPINYGGNVLEELKHQVRADNTAEIRNDRFGLEAGKLAVKNGLLDLEKAYNGDPDALRDLKPEDYALTRLPVDYDPEADGSTWRPFVGEVVETSMIQTIQEYIGHCLHHENLFERALLLVGGGENGKSTFLNTIEAMLGDDSVTSVSPFDFGDKPSLAGMHGGLANISVELEGGSLKGKNLANFKNLTGDDSVQAKRLYQNPFKFTYTGGLLFATNEVPDVPVSDDDTAFWRRWIIVHFDNQFPEGSDKRDPELGNKLQEPENLSAVLNWAIEGWGRLLENGEFDNVPPTPDETRRKWQQWGDSLDHFLSNVAEHDPDAPNVTTGEAWEVYRAWCQENGHDFVGQSKFTSAAKDSDFGHSSSVRPASNTGIVRRGYTAFGTVDGESDPMEIIEGDDSDDHDDDRDSDPDRGLDDYDKDDEGGDDETADEDPGDSSGGDEDASKPDQLDAVESTLEDIYTGKAIDTGALCHEVADRHDIDPDRTDHLLEKLSEQGRVSGYEIGKIEPV